MDDSFSGIDTVNFDIPLNTVVNPEVDAALLEDEERRAKEIEDDLENVFDDISDDGTDHENESEDLSESESDDQDEDHNNDKSLASGHYESSVGVSSTNPDVYQRSESSVLNSDHNYEYEPRKDDSHERDNHSSVNSSHFSQCSQASERHDTSISDVYQHHNQNPAGPNYLEKHNRCASDLDDYGNSADCAGSVNPENSSQLSDATIGILEECRKFKILYETTRQELERVKREEINFRDEANQTIETYKLRLTLSENEKDRLTSCLDDSQNLISDYKHKNITLLGELKALELQLSSMTKAKDEVRLKLEGSEVTIKLLEERLKAFDRDDNLPRLRDQHESTLKELKLRHGKEILNYKENIDKLQSKLNSKTKEAEKLILKNSELQQKYEKLQVEKVELVNKMSEELEITQRRYQQHLESGTIEEVHRLKLQLQNLQEEKSNAESENSALRDEIKSLKMELSACVALEKLTFSSKKHFRQKEESDERRKEINLQQELENSLKNVRMLRSEKHTLKKQLNDTENELKHLHTKNEQYEIQCLESEKRLKEAEEKLNSISSKESISVSFYEKKIKSLEDELRDCKINLHDVNEKLKEACLNEKRLYETNEELQKKISELVQKHAEDKIKAVEKCREKCLQLHESAIQKEKEKILAKADIELKNVCIKYENKITELEREIKVLNDGLYDSKTQYLSVYKDNQDLQEKLNRITKPKEREEIEKEILLEYEKKLTEIKSELTRQNNEYLAEHLKMEVEKAQIEWTQNKMAEIKEFIESTKQQLDIEFNNCLQKEKMDLQKKLEMEKETIRKEYLENTEILKRRFEDERDKSSAKLNQDMQYKLEQQLDRLKEHYENKIKFMQQQFENKLSQMEKEMKSLKENISLQSNEKEEVQKLKQDLMLQQEIWQKEKKVFVTTETLLNENVKSLSESEKKLREKIKKYQRHVAALEKRHQEKVNKLQEQLSELQKSCNEKQDQVKFFKDKYEQEFWKKCGESKSFRTAAAQTEEEMVPKQKIINLESNFFKCLMNISDDIRHYVTEAKKRNAEKLQAALLHYHQQVSSKLFQGLSKDLYSFTPTIVIPHTSERNGATSKETFESSTVPHGLFNAKFKTSTPSNMNSFGNFFVPAEKMFDQNNTESAFTPNLRSQTNVKSICTQENSQSKTGHQNFSLYKTQKANTLNSGDNLLIGKNSSGKGGLSSDTPNIDVNNCDKFEDISYDFLSLNHLTGHMNKMAAYRLQEGDIVKGSNNFRDSLQLFPSRERN